jgi:hypothetical protein
MQLFTRVMAAIEVRLFVKISQFIVKNDVM